MNAKHISLDSATTTLAAAVAAGKISAATASRILRPAQAAARYDQLLVIRGQIEREVQPAHDALLEARRNVFRTNDDRRLGDVD